MAYIEPNTRVLLLTGVPLDETYEHTLYFDNITAQTNYFMGQKKYEYAPQTYQRKGIGVITVQQKVEDLYDCGYLMFQNTSFGNKWFYAFVLDVEYVNNITTRVYYQIDYLQTWWFDITIHQCWVDREHIAVDAVGASLTTEDVGFGELELHNEQNLFGTDSYICIATSCDHFEYSNNNWEDQFARIITPDYMKTKRPSTACYLLCFDQATVTSGLTDTQDYPDSKYNGFPVASAVYDYLADHDQLDAIISVFELPKGLTDNFVLDGSNEFETGLMFAFDVIGSPKNKKLLQYPFNILELVDNNGGSRVYRPELFKLDNTQDYPKFRFGVTFTTIPETYAYPLNYNKFYSNYQGDKTDKLADFDSMFVGNAMPQVAYATDSYKVWVAQNSTWFGGHRQENSEIFSPVDLSKTIRTTIGAGLAGAIGGGKYAPTITPDSKVNITQNGQTVTETLKGGGIPYKATGAGMAIGAGIGVVGNLWKEGEAVATKVSNREKAKLLPDKYNAGTGGVASQKRVLGVTLYQKCLNAKDVKRLDDYFDMYGYSCNDLKIPNTHSRPHWNYVKTSMANITGNIPSTDIQNIKAIFNNGITFWKNPSEVGNYSLNNH